MINIFNVFRRISIFIVAFFFAAAALGEPPRLDEMRQAYVHEAGTSVVQTSGGKVMLQWSPWLYDEGNQRRYNARAREVELDTVYKWEKGGPVITPEMILKGVDAKGRGWYRSHTGNDSHVWHLVEGSRKSQYEEQSHYEMEERGPRSPVSWPRYGHEIVVAGEKAYILEADHLVILEGGIAGEKTIIHFPKNDKDDADIFLAPKGNGSMYYNNQMYMLGDEIWISRTVLVNTQRIGTIVWRIAGGEANLVARYRLEYVTGIIQHNDNYYLLVETQQDYEFTPKRIDLISQREKEIPNARGMGAKLEGVSAGRLIYVDRQGRQYFQPYFGGKPMPTFFVLDGKKSVEAKMPSPEFVLDCQSEDGRIFGHDGNGIYTLAKETFAPEMLGRTGNIATEDLKIIGARGRLLCISTASAYDAGKVWTPKWVDVEETERRPALEGKLVADGVALFWNRSDENPVTVEGLNGGGPLWYVKYESAGESVGKVQLCRASEDGAGKALTGAMTMSHSPTLWVLGPDTAVVIAQPTYTGKSQAMLYHKGEASMYDSFKELVSKRGEVLIKTMPDGLAYKSGYITKEHVLVKLGDALFVQHVAIVNDGTSEEVRVGRGVFRDGKWIADELDPDHRGGEGFKYLVRVVDMDIKTRRMLAFTDGAKKLQWLPLDSGEDEKTRETVAEEKETPWGCVWYDMSSAPRLKGGWFFTPEAQKAFVENEKQKQDAAVKGESIEAEKENAAKGVSSLQRWSPDGNWKINQTILAGAVHGTTDHFWQILQREAQVVDRAGAMQIVEMDAGNEWNTRITEESPQAVWIASAESVTRFVLEKNADGRGVWKLSKRFRLPRMGVDFAGPWIAGTRLYWMSGKKLYQRPLAELVK